ncbi:MAG TPA: L-histidine N(alpha)-methyltransferase [Thermoanaerobaculia bacterium]|jgi:L-histidine N-alpha-methyltransferase|nr:L-histidine N(alpha)-methyltransferase [Thermoanaerobaculia bacterium]
MACPPSAGAAVEPLVTVEVRRRPDAEEERRELLAALRARPRSIPSKHFYDVQGLALFDEITELPEYYPTRTERAILERVAPEVARTTGAAELVELGSGSATKTRLLLDALHAQGTLRLYVPVDVNEASLQRVGEELVRDYPGLRVHGVAADFLGPLTPLPDSSDDGAPRLAIFLGGTLGNLRPSDEAPAFLARLRAALASGDWFLLGVDLVKDVATLEAAYDDDAGVTAEFNRNVLRVVNRLLRADFDPARFRHRAFYDTTNAWIEMRLVAEGAQTVRLGVTGETLRLLDGEEIRTEISAKYTRQRAEALLRGAGFVPRQWHTDEQGWFGVSLARAV